MEGLSVLITTLNNLRCLKLCLTGLEKYSGLDSEVIIHVDGSTDGTVEWLEERGYEFSLSEWRGIYAGWNMASERATRDYLIVYSDDMFCAPGWDVNLLKWMRGNLCIVPRLVEPYSGSYPPIYDCGKTPEEFNEEKFVEYAKSIMKNELKVGTFGAFCMPRNRYETIGGFDLDLGPVGVGSIDLITRLKQRFPDTLFYEAQDVIVYHFQKMAFDRVPNKEELCQRSVKRFQEKWGFNVDEAYRRLERSQCELSRS